MAPARRTSFASRYCSLVLLRPFSFLSLDALPLSFAFVTGNAASSSLSSDTAAAEPLTPFSCFLSLLSSVLVLRLSFLFPFHFSVALPRARGASSFVLWQRAPPRSPRLFWGLVTASFLRHPRRGALCPPLPPLQPPPPLSTTTARLPRSVATTTQPPPTPNVVLADVLVHVLVLVVFVERRRVH